MMGKVNSVSIGISVIIWFLFSGSLQGQISEHFTDGNVTINPLWLGDTSHFEVNASKQLHLKGTGTDSSYISTCNVLFDSTEWNIWVRLSFSPSANNYCRIYLCSDSADLFAANTAFYLQLGESGSSDAIELFKQAGNQRISVCRGKEGFIAASFAVRIKITHEVNGKWTIYADSTGGNVFLKQAEGFDNTPFNPLYFGILCKYTSSNATKFYFDDILVKNIEVDLDPPVINSIRVMDARHLHLSFNEAMEATSVNDPLHYFADQGMGHPEMITLVNNQKEIILTFPLSFVQKNSYSLHLTGLKDLSGNPLPDTAIPFLYYPAGLYDVVINEMLIDPEPQLGLPPVEYVELFNTSGYLVEMIGWKIKTGSVVRDIPPFTLKASSFVILADSNAKMLFSGYGDFLGIPALSLANDGSTVSLFNQEDQIIHNVTYSPTWYDNPLKSEGGWSLEQIDPENPCAGPSNWAFSQSAIGGTPGFLNSVNATNPDISNPLPEWVSVLDARNIEVFFNESLDTSTFAGISAVIVKPGNLNPEIISFHSPDYCSARIKLPASMEKGVVYTLIFTDTLVDCSGNITFSGSSISYGLPEEADSGDVVINEILFDPENSVPEFFEIYNVSNKIITLNTLQIAETDSITFDISSLYQLSPYRRLLFPGDYMAFTTDPVKLQQRYLYSNPTGIIRMDPFPSLVNAGGCFSLIDLNARLIDRTIYREEMHYPLLSTTKGVSLERINARISGMYYKNWHSASSSSGYATPAMKNSQSFSDIISDSDITLEPQLFSPDNDGYQDLLSLHCKMNDPGFLVNISVYNTSGELLRVICKKHLLGNEDTFYWDGTDDKGYLSPLGMYIIYFEFFNSTGKVKDLKKIAVVGSKL